MLSTRNRWRTLAMLSLVVVGFAAATQVAGRQDANDTTRPHRQSVFVSPGDELAFGITIPDDDATEDVYFSLATQPSVGWAAVGLGSDSMGGGALVLMVYASAGGGVTFSPRLTLGSRSEPVPYPGLDVEVLPGSGPVRNGSLLMLRARCRNCRSWPGGGRIDVGAPDQRCIWAAGGGPSPASDDPAAPLRYHAGFGAFTIDLHAARGPAGPPTLDIRTARDSVGAATLGEQRAGRRDWLALVHAVAMVLAVFGVLPLGVVLVRVFEWVRWHAAAQTLALAGVVVGFGLGVAVSPRYNRSRAFRSPHQVLGFVFFAFVLAQLVLGVLHHRIHKRGGQGSRLAPVHVWLGRTIILMGVINAFLGFPFALSPGYNYILAGLVLAITPLVLFLLFWKAFFRRKLWGRRSASSGGEPRQQQQQQQQLPSAYGDESWRQHYSASPDYAVRQGQQPPIGLSNLGGGGTASSRYKEAGLATPVTAGLGVQQTPRETV